MSLPESLEAIVDIVTQLLQLPPGRVIWKFQDTNQPDLPYAALDLSPLSSQSQDGVLYDDTDGSPSGRELTRTTFGTREAVLTVEVFTKQSVDAAARDASARGLCEYGRAALCLNTIQWRLASQHLAFYDADQVEFLPALVSVGFRGRAVWTIKMRLPAETAREYLTYIETMGITVTVHGGLVDPTTIDLSDSVTPLAISPATVTVLTGGLQEFTASGGVGTRTWSISPDNSGGSITQQGVYTAGDTPGTDTVVVTDEAGETATATVTVVAPVVVSPATVSIFEPGGSAPPSFGTNPQQFAASGGTPPYTWSSSPNDIIDEGNGLLFFESQPAGTAPVTHTITATDAHGRTGTAVATVLYDLAISPSPGNVNQGATLQLSASGGSDTGYTWAITTNHSGSTIDASTGLFHASAVGTGTDAVTVTDSDGFQTTGSVTVRSS